MYKLSFEDLRDEFNEWWADNKDYTLHEDEWDEKFDRWCEDQEYLGNIRMFEDGGDYYSV